MRDARLYSLAQVCVVARPQYAQALMCEKVASYDDGTRPNNPVNKRGRLLVAAPRSGKD